MDRTRWRLLNPIEWAKALYGLVGTRFPTTSLITAMILGALVFGALWLIAAQQYAKDHPQKTITSFQALQQAARERAAELKRTPAAPNASSDLEISSPDNVRVRLRSYHQPETGIDGLLVNVINDRPNNLKACRITVHDARSFDTKRSTFREGFGLTPVQLSNYLRIFAGDASKAEWFVRVVGGNLEVGNSRGAELRWPSGDPSEVQIWMLTLTLEAETLTPWNFEIRMEWSRQSNAIKIGLP